MGKSFRFTLFLVMVIILSAVHLSTKQDQKKKIWTTGHKFKKEAAVENHDLDLDFGKIPLYFIPNEGQFDERAVYCAKASRYTLWLTKEELVFDRIKRTKRKNSLAVQPGIKDRIQQKKFKSERDVSRMRFLQPLENVEVVSLDITEHKINYFFGNDASQWKKNIPTSRAVLYREIYRNIDLKVYGVEKEIEYDWLVRTGGNVDNIQLEFSGTKETRIDKKGNLVVELESGKMVHRKPESYQRIGGEKRAVEVRFRDLGNSRYGFGVEGYDENYDLVIDPVVLVFSTYIGGTGNDEGISIAVNDSGNAYVTGYTASTNFPRANAYMSDPDGSLYDAFVTKLSTSGSSLVYSTYLGGVGNDEGRGIAVDDSGNAYVTGYTASTNFPNINAYMSDPDGGLYDAFVTKLSASGSSLVYSTYLGGTGNDQGHGIAVSSTGNAYVTGYTASTNFPNINAYMSDPDGSTNDAFVTKLSASGSSLVYSTYLGGTGSDQGHGIAVDSAGKAYVTGYTASTNFPRVDAYMSDPDGSTHDAFVTKLSASGTSLAYSTYLGGTGSDQGHGIAVSSTGNAYVTGYTESLNFPTVKAYMNDPDGSLHDAFVTKLSSNDTPPEVVITNPTDGATVSGIVTVLATASDDEGVTKVEFYVDGALRTSDTVSPYAYTWDTRIESNGGHTIEAIAFDTVNQTASEEISVTVNNVVTYGLTIAANTGGTTDPSPGNYSFVSGTQVAVKAIPNTGHIFTFWTGNIDPGDKHNNPLIVTMNKNISINANFYELPAGYATYVFDGHDFDGDTDSDIAVFRPSNGRWYIRNIATHPWGTAGDIPVNGDYDSDSSTDIAIWRPTNGRWYVRNVGSTTWGIIGDIPVPGDYDGDGTTEIAVWRPSNGNWYVLGIASYAWGAAGDIPVPGDYDGDGTTDIAVWRPSNGRWYIKDLGTYVWGAVEDIPVPGDYNGNGVTDIAVWRPSIGRWYIKGAVGSSWGTAGDIPAPGDYDGDGSTDIAVWRPSNGRWYIKDIGNYLWGMFGDIPLVR